MHWTLVHQLDMEISPANKIHVAELTDHLDSLGFKHLALESVLGAPANSTIASPVYLCCP